MAQLLTPTSTGTPSQWLLGAGASKHAALAADDGDAGYVYSTVGLSQVQVVGLSAGVDPGVHTGHQLVVVFRRVMAVVENGVRIGVQLYDGATPITGVERSPPATDSWQTFTYDLSEAEAAAISDYGNLSVRIVSPAPAVTGFELRATAVWLSVPDPSEALVAWTLAEGACDAVGGVLASGLNAKLAEVEARYSDALPLGQVNVDGSGDAVIWRSPVSFAGPLEHWPAVGVYAEDASAAVLNAAGHGNVFVTLRLVAAVSGQDDADVVERQVQRVILSVMETVWNAYPAGGLGGWDLMAQTPQLRYATREYTRTSWTREAHLVLKLSKAEAV